MYQTCTQVKQEVNHCGDDDMMTRTKCTFASKHTIPGFGVPSLGGVGTEELPPPVVTAPPAAAFAAALAAVGVDNADDDPFVVEACDVNVCKP